MESPSLILRIKIIFGLFYFVSSQICDDGSYTLLNQPRRSVQTELDTAVGNPLCDYGMSEVTWFRFLSYTGDAVVERNASNPVPMLHCGTEAPIYISGLGSHPITDYSTTNATVCANYGGNACKWTETIQILRCPVEGNPNYYFLYKLQSPPGCSLSYCVGEEPVCDQGDYWNGYSCVDHLPQMNSLNFSGPHYTCTNGSELSKEIFFSCEVQYERQPNDSNARFRVTFLFDGQPLESVDYSPSVIYEALSLEPIVLRPDSLLAILDESHLRGRLGKEISCQAESYWDGVNDVTSKMLSVTKYYASFESTSESYNISLTNESTFNVTFKSTLPLTCSHCLTGQVPCPGPTSCKYTFRLGNYSAGTTYCYLYWTEGDTTTMTVYFVPGSTQETHSFALVFESYVDDMASGPSLWHDYMIPTVKMTILPQSKPYKRCNSNTDPHQMTFDGAYFNIYLEGDFYLATAINAKQHMEIQVRHEKCGNGEVTCNCGLIVREGNSAFKISICEQGPWDSNNQRSPTVVRLLSQYPEDAAAVYIDGTGLIFSVRMPSGLRVEADLRAPWFNVDVYLPPEYHGKTSSASMCGNSNSINDDSTSNLEQFRVPDHLSYFRHQPNCSTIFNPNATRCGCNNTYPICSNEDPTLENISPANDPFSGSWTSGVTCSQTPIPITASSSSDSDSVDNDFILDNDILFPPYTYDPNVGVNVSFTWPTPKLKTKEEVEEHCANMLQSSPAYADCTATVDIAALIAMCATDIQIADDWISISAYAYILEQNCLNIMAASINSSDSTAHDTLKSVSAKLCPNKCSDHGNCAEGTCTCNTGYIGADCSIDQSLPPSLTSIMRGGMCDVRARPCDVISLFGSGVAFSSPLKCRFTDQTSGTHVETRGTFITAVEYSCPVPETTTHRRRRSAAARTSALSAKTVSITVDGVLYSNALDFVLYDSVCMECSSSDTCRQTDNSCLISDECFADKAFNPGDSCFQCVPSASRNSWTDIKVVEDWSSCTRECDTGVAIRNTVCGTEVTNEEVEFCKTLNCPENAEQTTQGFGITLSSEDLKLILKDPVDSLVPFADALNQYCAKNAATCCRSIGMETKATAVAYTSPDFMTYASGYPIINTNDASLKIIVKIDRAKLVAECSQTQTQESNIVYGAPDLLYDAVTSEKDEIEMALSITITSVWSSTSPPSSTPRTSLSLTMVQNLIGFWVFVVLVRNNLV